ncbi:hypothetical protein IVB14_18990 [Bradyrhizobium sp. 180]|uniref:hypothetical protein n=1 Tax=Bradyrhizobium sp. 180 TaxID=2782650 RepID=UPI001FFB9A04|nr:hypothetical protein [Bradyrhizobium sp. 180]MCK1492453.1 hypothetical protein [Bradyrhizobium sp. 180]
MKWTRQRCQPTAENQFARFCQSQKDMCDPTTEKCPRSGSAIRADLAMAMKSQAIAIQHLRQSQSRARLQ